MDPVLKVAVGKKECECKCENGMGKSAAVEL